MLNGYHRWVEASTYDTYGYISLSGKVWPYIMYTVPKKYLTTCVLRMCIQHLCTLYGMLMYYVCNWICENQPLCRKCTLEIRPLVCQVILESISYHCKPGSLTTYIVVRFGSHQCFRNVQPIRAPSYGIQ